ncbi:hypothetical protein [Flavobacterium notoginsengisoli]|uniref:hypothetical protein n=1 Tax=Flavobacterium notoginsengisoli TaxID=1478199 RepID=UPI00362E6BA4
MEPSINRVEQELIQFRAHTEKIGKLFPSDKGRDRYLLSEKIRHYGYLLLAYKQTRNPEELYLLKRVRFEKGMLEKELYPNRFVRFLSGRFTAAFSEKKAVTAYLKETAANSEKLLEAVSRCGFQIAADKILSNLLSGKNQFTVPVSRYVNEKERMEHQLFFFKDSSGGYGFDGFKASLFNDSDSTVARAHFFKSGETFFNPQQAYHLLAGRAVEKDGVWVQFDLNDRSAEGNYRMKEFYQDYGFDLKNAIETLPLKNKSTENMESLLNGLRHGERCAAVFEVKERDYCFSIEAGPQFKAVNIYDDDGKKISLSALKGKRTAAGAQKKVEAKTVKQKNKRTVRIR